MMCCCQVPFLKTTVFWVVLLHTLVDTFHSVRGSCCLYLLLCRLYTGYTQKNGSVSKVNKKFISHLTWAQLTPSAAATVQVSHALPVVCFSCLLRGPGASFQDGVAPGKCFLCAPF
jgi:hypothetical protein